MKYFKNNIGKCCACVWVSSEISLRLKRNETLKTERANSYVAHLKYEKISILKRKQVKTSNQCQDLDSLPDILNSGGRNSRSCHINHRCCAAAGAGGLTGRQTGCDPPHCRPLTSLSSHSCHSCRGCWRCRCCCCSCDSCWRSKGSSGIRWPRTGLPENRERLEIWRAILCWSKSSSISLQISCPQNLILKILQNFTETKMWKHTSKNFFLFLSTASINI